jgi:hypothetical protein
MKREKELKRRKEKETRNPLTVVFSGTHHRQMKERREEKRDVGTGEVKLRVCTLQVGGVGRSVGLAEKSIMGNAARRRQ